MADNIVDKFIIGLNLDTKGIDKDMQGLAGKLAGGLKSLAMNVVAPVMGALASGALINTFVDEIGVVNELSKTVGVHVEQLGAWKNALIETGADATKTGDIFRKLNDGMIDGAQRGRGILHQYVEKGLLPDFKNAAGEMKNTEDYLLEISDVIAGMDTRTATGILSNVAGITDTDTVEFLQQGSKALRENVAQARLLGVYTEKDVKLGKDYDASVNAVAHTLKMMLLPVFRVIVPVLLTISEGLRTVMKHSTALVPALVAIGAVLMQGILPAIKACVIQAYKFMMTPAGALISGLILLGLLFEDFIVWMEGGESAFGDFYDKFFGGVENAREKFAGLLKLVEDFGELLTSEGGKWTMAFGGIVTVLALIASVIGGVATAFGAMGVAIGAAIAAAVTAIMYLWANWGKVTTAMSETWDAICTAFNNKWTEIVMGISYKWYNMTTALSDAWDTFVGVLTAAFAFIASKFSWLTNTIQGAWTACVGRLTGVWDGFKNMLSGTFDWLASKFSWLTNGINGLKNIASNLPGIGNIVNTLSVESGQAVPASASVTNNSSNSNTNVDQKVNVTIQGNADESAIRQAQNPDGWGAWVSQVEGAYS